MYMRSSGQSLGSGSVHSSVRSTLVGEALLFIAFIRITPLASAFPLCAIKYCFKSPKSLQHEIVRILATAQTLTTFRCERARRRNLMWAFWPLTLCSAFLLNDHIPFQRRSRRFPPWFRMCRESIRHRISHLLCAPISFGPANRWLQMRGRT